MSTKGILYLEGDSPWPPYVPNKRRENPPTRPGDREKVHQSWSFFFSPRFFRVACNFFPFTVNIECEGSKLFQAAGVGVGHNGQTQRALCATTTC
ncbi:hypothetical protein CEXT_40131 [Caerostris extrusa]|uniref:Uncharacterized protein n=1 Tax=Caerostris extrusa TaxID=172846 RepID=A0AAV4MSW6_CAEEX|nr:hypothetical protein CEXT_40131 [Caerostris extrusa]